MSLARFGVLATRIALRFSVGPTDCVACGVFERTSDRARYSVARFQWARHFRDATGSQRQTLSGGPTPDSATMAQARCDVER